MDDIPYLISMLTAVLLGVLIGVERQWRHRMAGIRTTALVTLGAAVFASITQFIGGSPSEHARVAAQVVSGIGFLGGGIIMRDGFSVRGLNTAATIWCSAAVGVMCGLGYLKPAFLSSLIILGVNVLLRPIAHRMDSWGDDHD